MTLKAVVQFPVCSARVHLWLYDDQDGGVWVAKPMELVFEQKTTGPERAVFPVPAPTLDLPWSLWQRLLLAVPEAITGTGVETRATANAAELRATKVHLEDMRKLAFAAAHAPSPGRVINRPEIERAFGALRRAGFCETGLAAVQDLVKALSGEGT